LPFINPAECEFIIDEKTERVLVIEFEKPISEKFETFEPPETPKTI
jgi:hypothetical protein